MHESETSRELIDLVLESFSRERNAAIALFKDDGNAIFASKGYDYFSPLCALLHQTKKTRVKCERDHKARAEKCAAPVIGMCHAGLLNASEPIFINGRKKAVLLCGQKRVKDNKALEKESEQRFEGFIKNLTLSETTKQRIRSAYKAVGCVTQEDLRDLTDRATTAANLIYQISAEQEAIDIARTTFEVRVRNIAHELQIYNQGAVAAADRVHFELEKGRSPLELASKMVGQLSHVGTTVSNLLWTEYKINHVDDLPVEVIALIEKSVANYRWLAHHRGVNIIHDARVAHCLVNGSSHLLQHLLNNLVHNAVKYSYAGLRDRNRIVEIVSDTYLDEYLIIDIKNYGIGIEESELATIWDPGTRGVQTFDEHRTGSGLGLTIAKDVVEMHGGRITAKSQNQRGSASLTIFTVALPLA